MPLSLPYQVVTDFEGIQANFEFLQSLLNDKTVESFNGRTGAVTPENGDYAISQIDGTVKSTWTGSGTSVNTGIPFGAGTATGAMALLMDASNSKQAFIFHQGSGVSIVPITGSFTGYAASVDTSGNLIITTPGYSVIQLLTGAIVA